MTNGRAETLRILAAAFDELEQLRCRLREDNNYVQLACDAAREQERAAVVAYLLDRSDLVDDAYTECAIVAEARNIERGEHRKETP